MKNHLFILMLLVVVSACKTTKEKSSRTLSDLKGSFKVSMLNGQDISEKGLTFIIDESTNRVSGNSGCNTYGGNYELSETTGNISFSMIFASKKYCTEQEKNDLERQYLAALSKSFKVVFIKEGIQLEATDDSDQKIRLVED